MRTIKEGTTAYQIANAYQSPNDFTSLELLRIITDSPNLKIPGPRLNSDFARLTIPELMKLGLNKLQATKVKSAFAFCAKIGMRISERPKVKSSDDAYAAIAPILENLPYEEFWILLLNRSNRIINKIKISQGGVSGTVIDAKIIFKYALEDLASNIILCHNHPSTNLVPSNADKEVTKKLVKAGSLLDITVLDHLIISKTGFYSFADEGII